MIVLNHLKIDFLKLWDAKFSVAQTVLGGRGRGSAQNEEG